MSTPTYFTLTTQLELFWSGDTAALDLLMFLDDGRGDYFGIPSFTA